MHKPVMKLYAAIVATAISMPVLADPVNVSVLSWNIHRGIGSNSPNSGQQSSMAKVINYLNPDVWTIQELGGNSTGYNIISEKNALVSFISSNVTIFGANPVEGKDYYVYVGTATDGYIGNAIVSRYALSGQATYYDGLRGIVHADVSLSNGATLGIFTQHMKATTSSSDSTSDSQKRQAEAVYAAYQISNWQTAHPGMSAVFTGDLNVSQDAGQSDNWDSGNIGDSLPNGQLYQPISTILAAGMNDSVPLSANGDKDTIKSGGSNPATRFDYNMYSSFGDIEYVDGMVFNSAAYRPGYYPAGISFGDSGSASDHLPVFAVYSVDVPEPATLAVICPLTLCLLRRKRM